ncbi:Uncharacterised protein [Mycobacteroides abscessus subsp. abscessus]|nr:Uncharacterised protein [Mycobacteroides abscessus subsp. abscessus]
MPVLPTSPGMSASSVAVPPVTVSRIMVRSCSATPAGNGSGCRSGVPGLPATIAGAGTEPRAIDAATSAIPNGDAVTCPWPMLDSTRAAGLSAAGTFPVTVVSPGVT